MEMNGHAVLFALAQGLLMLGAIGAAQTALAWWAGRRAGGRGLLLAWSGATVVGTGGGVLRLLRRQAALGFQPELQHRGAYVAGALAVAAFGFGATTLVARRRLRGGAARLGVDGLAAGAGAMVGAVLAALLVVAVTDFAGIFEDSIRTPPPPSYLTNH